MNLFYTDDIIDVIGPSCKLLGPVKSGATVIATTAPGCWGPMITPEIKSGHEVTGPVAVEGAVKGDAIVIRVKKINILSTASGTGTDAPISGRFNEDPFVASNCPKCGEVNPDTVIEGIGKEAVRCKKCGTEANPFDIPCGVTMIFDEKKQVGITVPPAVAETIAKQASAFSALPKKSRQHSVNLLKLSDIYGTISSLKPMIGNMGTLPGIDMPSSHNAGDFGAFLVGATHRYGITSEQLNDRTDAHMDLNEVGEGSVVIAPVFVDGGGIYVGDVHALQGDGEIAGHTVDVSAEVTIQVEIIKGLNLAGPIVLPCPSDVAQGLLLSSHEIGAAKEMAAGLDFEVNERSYPLMVVGSGVDLNTAVDNGLERMASFFQMSLEEVKLRVTITGNIDIGRLPGVVGITMSVPFDLLKEKRIGDLMEKHYTKT